MSEICGKAQKRYPEMRCFQLSNELLSTDTTHRLPTSRGALKSDSAPTPPLTINPFPFVTRTSSLAAAHQFLFAPAPDSPPPVEISPSPPRAPAYAISNTAPFLMVVLTRVCLRWKGRRGSVSGSEIICAVSGDGRECVRHTREKVAEVVGVKAIMSYGWTRDMFPFVWEGLRRLQRRITGKRLTRPNPFSLSSSKTMVSRFKNIIPVRFLSSPSNGSSSLTWLFGSIFFCTI
jgi:hypothetical protein